jgi:hypothetical protein
MLDYSIIFEEHALERLLERAYYELCSVSFYVGGCDKRHCPPLTPGKAGIRSLPGVTAIPAESSMVMVMTIPLTAVAEFNR